MVNLNEDGVTTNDIRVTYSMSISVASVLPTSFKA